MLAYLFLAVGIIVHMLSPNLTFGFSPLGASLLFFGANRSRKEFFFVLPAVIASDFYLNHAYGLGYTLHLDQWIICAWYLGACFLGVLLKNRVRPHYVMGAALALSVSFFLVSDFAVWAGWNMYPKTWSGLVACYVAAIPFFKKGIPSDLIFSVLFFGIPVLAERWSGSAVPGRKTI